MAIREGGGRAQLRRPPLARPQAVAGWVFVAPALVILVLFLLLPILTAVWVSVADWTGNGSPVSPDVNFVGLSNYSEFLAKGGLAEQDFGTSIRNNLYYVVISVPLVTAAGLALALLVNKARKGTSFFRTAFYFPSISSSVAMTVIFLFLFNSTGAINELLGIFSIHGPSWMEDPRGVIHLLLSGAGIQNGPAALTGSDFLGISWWEWLAGPSVAMCVFILMAAFAASGTFMLIFLAGLQQISSEVEEAGVMDGAGAWKRFWYITLPMLRPTVFTVMTLALIGSWQVFDQIYTGSQGNPAKTTLTPAYLSYQWSFTDGAWGRGAAVSFILLAIIVLFTLGQRYLLRDRDRAPRGSRRVREEREI